MHEANRTPRRDAGCWRVSRDGHVTVTGQGCDRSRDGHVHQIQIQRTEILSSSILTRARVCVRVERYVLQRGPILGTRGRARV